MKFNVLRSFLIPWILYFVLAVAVLVMASLRLPARFQDPHFRLAVLYVGGFLCLFANYSTMNKAGIWIAESLPYSIRYGSAGWFARAVFAAIIAAIFYFVGLASWMPLYWQGFVIPFVFTVAIFIIVRSLLGIIIKTAANVMFIRFFILIMSLPILFGVGVTALFLSQDIVASYEASQPELVPKYLEVAANSASDTASPQSLGQDDEKDEPVSVSKRAKLLQAAVEKNQACSELNKEIKAGLETKVAEDVAYWAVRAVKCSDMKSFIVLPRLVDLMIKHKSAKVKGAAIQAMTKYNRESIKQVSYLLVKHINSEEPKEVLESATLVLSNLGSEERSSATKRLKALLDSPDASLTAAKILVKQLGRPDVVKTYVSEHLGTSAEARARSIAMICLLPDEDRHLANPFISEITASIKQGQANDPAMEALACIGPAGLQAVRLEVQNPTHLARPLAAQALAEMDLKNDPETLKTVEICLKDKNLEVRKWCSQSMGKIGALALPQILDLLKSKDPDEFEEGHLALNSFDDTKATDQLKRVRAENSGWMANRKNLQVASAVSNAITRLENKR